MDVATITAVASGLAIVLRAVAELVKALRARRVAQAADEPEPEPEPAKV